jgi:hypothetical protein
MKKNIPLALVILAMSLIGFFAGTKYQQSKIGKNIRQMRNMPTTGIQTRGNFRENMTFGEIVDISEEAITIKLPNNNTQNIFLQEDSKFSKSVSAEKTDLKIGANISAEGKADDSNNFVAKSIQILPN